MLTALIGNEAATDQWFGVLAGSVHPATFSAPENIAAIMDAAETPAPF